MCCSWKNVKSVSTKISIGRSKGIQNLKSVTTRKIGTRVSVVVNGEVGRVFAGNFFLLTTITVQCLNFTVDLY